MDKNGAQLKDEWIAGFSKQKTAKMTRGNLVELYFEGDEAFDAMAEAIQSAEVFVHLEMYLFFSDTVGKRFAGLLSDKAREGIPVRVVYDAIGSIEASARMFEGMEKAGVVVEVFRPVAPWRKRSGILGRNHRKNLIIDGRVAFTGGVNLGDNWSRKEKGKEVWRDTHIKLEGPVAAACDHFFRETWKKVDGCALPEEGHFKIDDDGPGESACMVVGGGGFAKGKAIRRLFSEALQAAERDIAMTVAYFVPPRMFLKILRKRSKEGVNIEVLVPRDSDVAIADWLREGLYPGLLKYGINFHEYLRSVLHAKSVVIDDNLSLVGSSNFDYLSISWNWELAVVIDDPEVAGKLREQYAVDLEDSETVDGDSAGARPWWRRMMSWIGGSVIRRF
ncbi:MAG: phosphatidylserine/phosphatidylglycerophosphate/cardiolipin synthase family protein [Akkermansiaceae bacterium]|jgi:cardiolipin synthase